MAGAQGIAGLSGTVQGTNIQATVEAGEPDPASGVSPSSTIWYSWTAPITTTMDFNTRGSVDPDGLTLDTMLGIYRLKLATGGLAYTNLTLVTGNELDPSGGNTSRVDFNAAEGTLYLIQVGSVTNVFDNLGQGTPILNWAPSLTAGGFGFSVSNYLMSSLENWLPDSSGSITPSLFGFAQGTPNARITVTRTGGYTGRCEVTVVIGESSYTNFYTTNYIGTNIFTTNYAKFPLNSTTEVSYTNTFLTNIAWVNWFTNLEDGVLQGLPADGDEQFAETNFAIGPTNGGGALQPFQIGPTLTPLLSFAQLNVTNWLTNFPCPLGSIGPQPIQGFPPTRSLTLQATNLNTDGSITVTQTNIFCYQSNVLAVVPSAFAGQQVAPLNQTLTFDDYQMSQDVYVQVYPILNTIGTGFGERPRQIAVIDYPTPGPEDLFEAINNLDYFYNGLNAAVTVTLTNAVLDPLEDPDIIPPTIGQTNATINILNFYGNPEVLYSNAPIIYSAINFERYTYRCNKNCGNAVIFVQRSYRDEAPATGDYTVHYTMDSTRPNQTVIDDNKFATVADSDYAIPANGQADYDFTLPVGGTWTGIDGVLTFNADVIDPDEIIIPIVENGAVEFDSDIELQLYQTAGDFSTDIGGQPPAILGPVSTARLTINFDNIASSGVQPGGAVDRTYNVDGQSDSVPPGNLYPGADSSVTAVAIDSIGRAVIGGDFNSYNSALIDYVARILPNGLLDNTFTAGLGTGPNGFVNALAIDGSGRIIIGGDFNAVNATNAFHIARLLPNGVLDTSFATGYGFDNNVNALAIDASGNILVGGDFDSFNKTNCNHIARLLPNGTLDPTFLPSSGVSVTNGTDRSVFAVAVDNLGNVILGGDFVTVNGTNWNHIARLLTNGNLDLSFNPGFGADADVMALAVQPDNSIILGGAFQNFNLISRGSIARLTPGGVLDTSFLPGTGFDDIVYSLSLQPDGNILVGGQFTTYNGNRRVGLARILGGQGTQVGQGGWLDTSFMDTAYNQYAGIINHYYNTNAFNPNDGNTAGNQRNQVLAMGLQPDGNVVIGGNFWRVGGGFTRVDVHSHQNLARVIGPATPGAYGTLQLLEPNAGGLNNCPGNMTMTQNPYSVNDTGQQLYVTLDRVNGSLGPARLNLATNTLPPSSSSATAADFGLPVSTAVSYYHDVWDLSGAGATNYGWRETDGEYGFNNNIQTASDGGASSLFLSIHNDPAAAAVLYANLNMLNLTGSGLTTLGGVPMPFGPALGQSSSQLDIINANFPTGTLGFNQTNYNVLESAGTVTITILRTNGDNGSPSVTVVSSNGTAINGAGADYQWITTQESFGSRTKVTFTVPIRDYSTQQTNKFFYLYLSSATAGAVLNPNVLPTVATVTIIDDHFQPGNLSFSAPAYSVLKPGLATITVNRTGAALGQVTVMAGTSDGSAINGVNYQGVTNLLSWGSSDISPRTITVQTLQDGSVDGPKTVNLSLFQPKVGGVPTPQLLTGPSNAVLTIVDTDTNGSLNFLSHNFTVFQNSGQALITVTRSGLGSIVGSETVNFTTFGLTNVDLPFQSAMVGSNYGFTNGQLTFGPGVTSASFTVPVYQTSETSLSDRLVGLQIFNASPTNIAGQFPKTAILTILDPQLHLNSAGSVDMTTDNGVGFNAVVNSLALQPDASILAGGSFTYYNGYPFNHVGRMVADGSYDTGFLFNLTGPDNTVWQVLSQPPASGQLDGNIMIVGDFATVNQVNSPHIARLNLNGILDASFNPGAGADGTIYCITNMILPTASSSNTLTYVIGGAFANYNGTAVGGIARVTASGTIDSTFNVGSGAGGSNAVVHAIAVTPNNQILVGGDFTQFANQNHHHLVELNLDGTINTNFAAFDGITSDINGSIRALTVQPDGRILIGGLFTTVNGGNYNYIARLNPDGATDTNFNVGVGCDNTVQAVVLDDQLRILVGGTFSQASGVTRNGITRLNPNGTVDPSINFGFGANGYVDTILIQTNAEINLGGSFTSFNNTSENNFVRLYGGANAGNGSIQFSQQIYGIQQSSTNSTNALIGIQRIGGTFGSPSVSAVFATSNNTSIPNEAVPGVDYTPTTTTVTFPVGETFQIASVPISANAAIGPDLLVSLELTNPPANFEDIGPQITATLIITNENAGVEFQSTGFNQVSSEGLEAIPVIRVGNTNSTVTVLAYTGTNGTAIPGVNYTPTTNLLTFNPGVVTNYLLVTILNSLTTYQDTTVDLELENATNAIVSPPSSSLLTIEPNQTGPGFLTFSQTNYSIVEGVTNAVITVVRTNGNNETVTVQLTTSGGTAVPFQDYLPVSTNLTFQTYQNTATANIPILQSTNAGANRTIDINLSNPAGSPQPPILSSPTQAVLTIVSDLASFSFDNSSYFITEGSTPYINLTILRTGPTNGVNTVSYTTYTPPGASETNGFAVPGVDYQPTNGVLTFQPGVSKETIPVAILQTANVNPVISFQVLLQNPSAGTQIGVPGVATVGIISDVSGFAFATNAYAIGENGTNLVVTINRFNANTGPLSVSFSTIDTATNTAIAGVDFIPTNEVLNFLNGQATTNITIAIPNPNLVESNKTFTLVLSNPTTNSYVVQPATAAVTITNVYVGLAFGSPTFTVSECATSAIIPVELTGLTNSTVVVNYATVPGGSAVPGINYDSTNGFLTFAPGQTQQNIYVTPINNHIIGPDHTVQLNLTYSAPTPTNVAGVQLLNPSTALLDIQECNGAFVVKSGTAFVSGSVQGATGVVYSNDIITVLFGLRDIAGGDAQNLMATLVLSNGVTSNGIANFNPTVNYGTLIQNGPTVSRPFTFNAQGSNGQNIIATLLLKDDANPNLGTVDFGFTIGGNTISFTNSATIFLPENSISPTPATNSIAPGFGYPSLINVSGVPGLITKASVTFSNFGDSFPSDVDAILEGPNGSNSILMSHTGSNFGVGSVSGINYGPPVTLTFDQTAASSLPLNGKLTAGTFRPTTNVLAMQVLPAVPTNETVPVQVPKNPYPYRANLNSAFLGSSPNGNWSLWAISDESLDFGYISNGWILNISTGVPVENDSDLEVTVNTRETPTIGNLLQYLVTVTNFGPSSATNIVITDYLPPGTAYLSNNFGGVAANGALTLNLPAMPTNTGTAFSVFVTPTNVGFITNIVAALAQQPDPNTNNIITNVSLAGLPSADVATSLSGGPSPVVVGSEVDFTAVITNNGPSDAGGVTNTLSLPFGFAPKSQGLSNAFESVSVTANLDGTLDYTWIINDLTNGADMAMTFATTATAPGIDLVSAVAGNLSPFGSITLGVYDPFKANNVAQVKVEVDSPYQPMINVSRTGNTYQITWSTAAANYTLQGAVSLPEPGSSASWVNMPTPPIVNGVYTFTLPGSNGYHYFRLRMNP
ncbi:MAG TPA: Calx-beta domain-containing protein [Verrucomicrobiae bacterium]